MNISKEELDKLCDVIKELISTKEGREEIIKEMCKQDDYQKLLDESEEVNIESRNQHMTI